MLRNYINFGALVNIKDDEIVIYKTPRRLQNGGLSCQSIPSIAQGREKERERQKVVFQLTPTAFQRVCSGFIHVQCSVPVWPRQVKRKWFDDTVTTVTKCSYPAIAQFARKRLLYRPGTHAAFTMKDGNYSFVVDKAFAHLNSEGKCCLLYAHKSNTKVVQQVDRFRKKKTHLVVGALYLA